jgi:hypothetical protein
MNRINEAANEISDPTTSDGMSSADFGDEISDDALEAMAVGMNASMGSCTGAGCSGCR